MEGDGHQCTLAADLDISCDPVTFMYSDDLHSGFVLTCAPDNAVTVFNTKNWQASKCFKLYPGIVRSGDCLKSLLVVKCNERELPQPEDGTPRIAIITLEEIGQSGIDVVFVPAGKKGTCGYPLSKVTELQWERCVRPYIAATRERYLRRKPTLTNADLRACVSADGGEFDWLKEQASSPAIHIDAIAIAKEAVNATYPFQPCDAGAMFRELKQALRRRKHGSLLYDEFLGEYLREEFARLDVHINRVELFVKLITELKEIVPAAFSRDKCKAAFKAA